ncbi:hypothetical protein CH063_01729 [Colletotrichum higginsianum]|uniref:Uncharacterized protein n=1 Tax=Colletotrichum higginsianum (strain IMI 349063) TaxID=759273 RepID=H1VBI8_COLHI|nr:hypothetical protein CH063_01729 [Colletotrichum higginsianum]
MTEHVVCDNLMRSIEDTCNEITNEMPDTDNTDTTDVSPTVNIDVEMNEESRSLEDATVVYNKPTERIFFFKRMKSEHPRLDVLFQVGGGSLRPGTHDGDDYAVWEASESLYLYRTTGPEFQVLQSVASVEYTTKNSQISKVRNNFSLKTCGVIGMRDAKGQLQVLKSAISGTEFIPVREQDKQDFLFDAKWVARVKVLAKLLRINLRTPFDGHSKPTSDGNVGNWRAGHIEKKLSTHMVYTLLAMYQKKKGKVTLKDLRHLRQILREEGFKPEFEIHLSRGPCGTPHRLGLCVPFVRRLSQITGVKFTIHS